MRKLRNSHFFSEVLAAVIATAILAGGISLANSGLKPNAGGGGQNPSAVAITGGSIVANISGTASSLISSDVTGLDLFSNRSLTAANYLKSKVGALTRFERIKPGRYDLGIDAATNSVLVSNLGIPDGLLDSGAVTAKSGHIVGFGTSVVQNPKTTPYGLYFRAKLVGSKGSYLGFQNAGSTDYIQLGHDTGVSTKWFFGWSASSSGAQVLSTGNADDNEHDFYMYFDGITMTLEVDGSVVCTNADLTHVPTTPMVVVGNNTTTLGVIIKEIVYGN